MVTALGGAGASMKIKGTLDTSGIERGFRRITQGFMRTEGQAKGFTSNLSRMRKTASSLTKGLVKVGLAGSSAMIGLASKAPAVAPALARIKTEFGKLTRTLGTTLQPLFEAFADKFQSFVGFVQAHPNILKGFLIGTGAIVGIEALSKLFGIIGRTVIGKGLLKLVGYLATATVSASMLSALGILSTIALTGAGGILLGKGLADFFGTGSGTNVPLTDAARNQISGANPQQMMDLTNRYADRISRPNAGPEQTARFDLETGELYGYNHMERDIIRYNSANMDFFMGNNTRQFNLQNSAFPTSWG